MVWGAPTPRSSGGRSAVSRTSGTPARSASTTAGVSSAAAVPEVTTIATGARSASARPIAKNPAALVQPDVDAHPRCRRRREHERRGAGPGTDHHVAHATARELVEEGRGERRLRGGGRARLYARHLMPSLAAVRQGEGPTVLLVHGFTQVATSMAPLAERLAAARRVVAVDLPGHGGSGAISADLDESAALVAAVADGEPFDLVGYSLGGRVALHAACRPPSNLRAVAVVSASPGIADPERRRARFERDVALAEALEADGDLDGFLRRWLAAPM